jgi:tRNA-splicing ligase RtcB (3'-phosphate/5'-hydroxy nucleic acid ligase)
MKVINGGEGTRPIKAWVGEKPRNDQNDMPGYDYATPKLDIEDTALQQLKNLSRLPFIASNGVAVMPDVHAGIGSTVGTVIATDKAVIPAAVGVDIGCGMNAVRLSLKASDLPESLTAIRHQIERDVPLGPGGAHQREEDVESGRKWMRVSFGEREISDMMAVTRAVGGEQALVKKASTQLGTLGSGNHFIELCLDENDDVWVMLHSGSRGIGNMIGRHYIDKAKRTMERFFITLPDSDLAYFPEETDDFNDYVAAVDWAQAYALENRRVMLDKVIAALRRHIPKDFTLTSEAISCHHNYVERENHFGKNLWVTRKGAVRARQGDLGIIPGSMGQQSYIVRGKGNPESYCSCSHGAGRQMSRAEAKRRFTLADLAAQTEGVECRKDAEVLDEIPGAYKRLDLVMENQKDLVEVVHTLRAVLCVKGN